MGRPRWHFSSPLARMWCSSTLDSPAWMAMRLRGGSEFCPMPARCGWSPSRAGGRRTIDGAPSMRASKPADTSALQYLLGVSRGDRPEQAELDRLLGRRRFYFRAGKERLLAGQLGRRPASESDIRLLRHLRSVGSDNARAISDRPRARFRRVQGRIAAKRLNGMDQKILRPPVSWLRFGWRFGTRFGRENPADAGGAKVLSCLLIILRYQGLRLVLMIPWFQVRPRVVRCVSYDFSSL
jgi:hypothetical protein